MIRHLKHRTFHYYIWLLIPLILAYTGCSKQGLVRTSVSNYNYRINEGPVDSGVYARINPYKQKLEEKMNEVIAFSTSEMVKGGMESTLGNFSADALLSMAAKVAKEMNLPEPHMAILNNGGLRTSLPKGNIRVNDVFELMPFENELVFVTISGDKMLDMLNFIAEKNEPVSGVKLGVKDKKAIDPMVGGQPFDSRKLYCVATSDYLANSGDKMSFFNEPVSKVSTLRKIRDLLIDYLRITSASGAEINPKKDGRIYPAIEN